MGAPDRSTADRHDTTTRGHASPGVRLGTHTEAMSTPPTSASSLSPQSDPAGHGRASGLGCLLVAVLLVCVLVATVVVTSRHFEERRLSRIDHAEDKYGLTYVRRVRDGEGGGQWRTEAGATLTCTISGDVADPMLACGEGEPPKRR